MKKMMSLVLVFNLFIATAFGQGQSDPSNNQGYRTTNNNNKTSAADSMQTRCDKVLNDRVVKKAADEKAGTAYVEEANPDPCDYFFYASSIIQEPIGANDQTASSDNAIVCVQKYGYTADYNACQAAVKKYNTVYMAEKAMQMQQGARQTISNNKISNEVQKQSVAGNGQGAALDATIQTNKNLAELNDEQKFMYLGAVGALSTAIKAFPGPNANGYSKVCKSGNTTIYGQIKVKPGLHTKVAAAAVSTQCPAMIDKAKGYSKSAVFANENAKAILTAKTLEFVQKGIAAGINANKLKNMASALQSTQDSYEDADMMLDKCVVNPTSAECMAPQDRVYGDAYQGGSFNIGAGGNSDNAFTNPTDDSFGEAGVPTTAGAGNISDIKSPFEDAAVAAKGILNPANAATITPGGSGAGAGGGGGGGGGGGSASLGDDIKGADASGNKEAEIKSSKFSGGYGSNGGGFNPIGGGKDGDEANPLAGLVDANGGIEEDRSIASEGIGGQDSGLFQKISNKYSQIQNEKRIEASNLE